MAESEPKHAASTPSDLAAKIALAMGASPVAVKWSEGEIKAQTALIHSGIRQRRADLVEQALQSFGGLPPFERFVAKSLDHPLETSAGTDDAFEFEKILEACLSALTSSERSDPKLLGKLLRRSLPLAGIDRRGDDGHHAISHHQSMGLGPISCCLRRDNPAALAKLLESPGAMQALAATEPHPLGSPYGRQECEAWERETIKSQHGPANIEGSLIYAAIGSRAAKCAWLLCSMTEFNAPMMQPRLHRQGMGGLDKGAFERKWASVESLRREPTLFSKALGIGGGDFAHGEESATAFKGMLKTIISQASEEAKSWRCFGTGHGWPTLAFLHFDLINPFVEQRSNFGMWMLRLFEEQGFEVEWDALRAMKIRKDSALAPWVDAKADAAHISKSASAGLPKAKPAGL